MARKRTVVSLVAVGIAVATACTLPFLDIGGGQTAIDRNGRSDGGLLEPASAASTAPPSTVTPGNRDITGELPAGDAVAADVEDLVTVVTPGRDRSPTGSVEAFASDASWLLGSVAAERNPDDAVRVISTVLNLADAEMLKRVPRHDLEFRAVDGAYRILGHSGRQATPNQVMIEVAAPLLDGDTSRWMIAGGVIAWVDGRWQLSSLQPREIAQPTDGIATASEMSAADIGLVLDGLGWTTFANAPVK